LTTLGESNFLKNTTSFLSFSIFSPSLSLERALTATNRLGSKALVAIITLPNYPSPSTLSSFKLYFFLISLFAGN